MFFRANPGNVNLQINIKLADLSSAAIVELEQPGDRTVKLIPSKGAYTFRNVIYKEYGENWIFRYRTDPELEKGKFWIQIKGTGNISFISGVPSLPYHPSHAVFLRN